MTSSFCASCGSPLQDGAVFCSSCGTKVEIPTRSDTPTPTGERRRITVLFSDLVGSTEMAGRMDPEDFQEIVDDYYKLAGAAIDRFGGHVANYLGDGVLAYFGYPTAYEDSAVRAVKAGLALLDAVDSHNVATHRDDISVRIGIHTGLVVIDDMGGDARRESHAMGDAMNLAARVQSAAEPGEVAISQETADLLGTRFETTSLGIHDLKGVADDVELFRVEEERIEREHLSLRDHSFVGREEEWATLEQCWTNMTTKGLGDLVTIVGEAGIGKSRLISEFHKALGPDVVWHSVRCSPYEQLTPFSAIAALADDALGGHEATDEEKLQRLGAVVEFLPGLNTEGIQLIAGAVGLPVHDKDVLRSLSPDEARSHLINWLAQGLTIAGGPDSPNVLILEDVHWADASSLEVIEKILELIDSADSVDTLVLMTSRPDAAPNWPDHSRQVRIDLEKLSAQQIEDLVTSQVGSDIDPEALRTIVARTDGVPLFAEELAHSASQPNLNLDDIPVTLNDSLLARLDGLGDSRRTAQLAAVLGREFDIETIQSVFGGDSLESDMATLAESGVIEPIDDGFHFRHALVQNAAYESLLKRDRRDLHAVVAANFARDPKRAREMVARHWSSAENPEKSMGAWREAAEQARLSAAHVEAVSHLDHAIHEMEALPLEGEWIADEIEIQYMLANSHQYTAGFASDEAVAAMQRANVLAAQLDNVGQQVGVLYGLFTTTLSAGQLGAAHELAERLWDLVELTDDPGHRRAIHTAMAADALNLTQFKNGVGHAREILANRGGTQFMTQEFDDVSARLYGGLCAAQLGDDMAYVEFTDPLFASAEKAEDPMAHLMSLLFSDIIHQYMGNHEEVIRLSNQLKPAADAIGMTTLSMYADIFGGHSEAVSLGSAEGLAKIERGLNDQLRTNQGLYLGFTVALIADGQRALGRLEEAQLTLDRAIDLVEQPHHEWLVLRTRAQLRHAMGADRRQIEDDFNQSIALAQEWDSITSELRTCVEKAKWVEEVDGVEAAVEALNITLAKGLSDKFLIAREARALAEAWGAPVT